MLHCSESTIRRLNILFLPQALVCISPVSCASFLQNFFAESFTIEPDFFCILVEAAIGFTAETNHFSATKLFFEKSRFSLVVFDVFDATRSMQEVTGRVGRKISPVF